MVGSLGKSSCFILWYAKRWGYFTFCFFSHLLNTSSLYTCLIRRFENIWSRVEKDHSMDFLPTYAARQHPAFVVPYPISHKLVLIYFHNPYWSEVSSNPQFDDDAMYVDQFGCWSIFYRIWNTIFFVSCLCIWISTRNQKWSTLDQKWSTLDQKWSNPKSGPTWKCMKGLVFLKYFLGPWIIY